MKTSDKRNSIFEEIQGTTEEIISRVRKLIKKGSVRRVIIQNKKGKVLFQSQLNAGLAGSALIAFLSPIIAAIGFFAVTLSDMKVVVEKYPAEDVDDYEVKAEVIEIEDEDQVEAETKADKSPEDEEVDKTVGKDEDK